MPEKAFAAVLTDPRTFEYREYAIPEIADDDGILRVEAAGLCGTDYEQYAGHLKAPWNVRPIIPGHEIQGRIERLGDRAKARWNVKEGDRVVLQTTIPCGSCYFCQTGRGVQCKTNLGYGMKTGVDTPPHLWGGYASHLYLHPNAVMHKATDRTSTEVLSLYNPMANAVYWAWERGGIGIGGSVVIAGPGQRGLLSVVVAKAAGAGLIVVTGTRADAERLRLARQLGAHATIIVDDEDPVARVRDLTGGEGIDVVLDVAAGSGEPILQAIEMIRPGGTIVLAGLKNHRPLEGFIPDRVVMKEIKLVGVLSSSWTSMRQSLALVEQYKDELAALCTHAYRIGEADTALRVLGREVVDRREAVHVHIDCR